MSQVTVEHFVSRYGLRSIPDIAEMLTAGKTELEITKMLCQTYPIHNSQFSRFLATVIEWKAFVREEVLEYLEQFTESDRISLRRARSGRAVITRLPLKESASGDSKEVQD